MSENIEDDPRKYMDWQVHLNNEWILANFIEDTDIKLSEELPDKYKDIDRIKQISDKFQSQWYLYELAEESATYEEGDRILISEAMIKPVN